VFLLEIIIIIIFVETFYFQDSLINWKCKRAKFIWKRKYFV